MPFSLFFMAQNLPNLISGRQFSPSSFFPLSVVANCAFIARSLLFLYYRYATIIVGLEKVLLEGHAHMQMCHKKRNMLRQLKYGEISWRRCRDTKCGKQQGCRESVEKGRERGEEREGIQIERKGRGKAK